MFSRRLTSSLFSLALTASLACSPEAADESECVGAKCDDRLDLPDEDIESSACDGEIVDLSGRRNEKVIGRLGDRIALALQKSDACPTSYAELHEILNKHDDDDCGLRTRVISEQASTIGAFGSESEAKANSGYRTVTGRECQTGDRFSVLFSQFGMGSDSSAPEDYEAIAFDEVEGVFNYYKLHGDGTFGWFGNSRDFLDGRGQEVTINETTTAEKNCAGCHISGGLIMKELRAPWVHWEQAPLPGASDLVGKNEDVFGLLSSGANLEGVVKAGNRRWNRTRIEHIRDTGTVEDLLRPLFCTEEVNLDSSGTRFPNLVRDSLGFITIDADSSDYEKLREDNEQTMITGADSDVTGPDTDKGNTFPARSFVDENYVDSLLDEDLIDRTLHEAILMVDFTRPVFSSDRCDLVRFAPDLSLANKRDLPKKIREGFIENIGPNATGAARELRRNLVNFEGDNNPTGEAMNTFEVACADRDILEAATDVMMLSSLLRSQARELEIMEFSGTMAFDAFEPSQGAGSSINAKSRLSPNTCEVVTRFVGVAEPVDDE